VTKSMMIDDIMISSLLPLAPMTQVACSHTKHRAGWDGNTGCTGTVAQSDKSTMHYPSNDIVMQWQCHSRNDGAMEGACDSAGGRTDGGRAVIHG